MGNDYATQDKWYSYAPNNGCKTFMLLFEKDFTNTAALTISKMRTFL